MDTLHDLWIAPLVALAVSQIAVIATSVYLHRGLAHRALRLHPVTDACCRALLWLTTGQRRREWVAVHRKHHTFTDREGDPHSPRLLGLWHVQFWNVYYYMREARNPQTIRTFAPDITEDWLDRVVFSRGVTGLVLGIALLCGVFGIWVGLTAGLVHATLYVFVLAPLINGLGHWRGAQNFGNTAYNSKLLAWVTGGESLHNNHHAHPRAPRFSMRRLEFDPSWAVIRCLARFRLIEIVGTPVRLAPSWALGSGPESNRQCPTKVVSLFAATRRVAGRAGAAALVATPGGCMTTGDLLAELRETRTDMARVVEAAAHPERAYVVVPIEAVKAWMEREPDAWAKVVEWFGANGKALVQV